MDDGTASFEDWEILPPDSAAAAETEVEAEGLMMLRPDYFSINDDNSSMWKYSDEGSGFSSEGGGSVASDNPSWVDPTVFPRWSSGEFWPDSASDGSKLSDAEESDRKLVFEIENRESYLGKLGISGGELSLGTELEDVRVVEKMSVLAENSVEKMEAAVNLQEEKGESLVQVVAVEDGESEKEVEQPINVEKKALFWWKHPLELVKFCIFRISPVWSISVAAAMLGVFIVRRRLHMMKKKTKGLQMKVTMDDKKVDQFMSSAARLNEAFSVVRRIPIIRPSLPSPGATPWTVVTMW